MEETVRRWAGLNEALKVFRTFLSASAPSDIKPFEAAQWQKNAKPEYPFTQPRWLPSKNGGVYLLYDNDGQLLYVGVARVNFDKRVWTHSEMAWKYLDVIPFDDQYLFLASALEHFLILRLKPFKNKSLNV